MVQKNEEIKAVGNNKYKKIKESQNIRKYFENIFLLKIKYPCDNISIYFIRSIITYISLTYFKNNKNTFLHSMVLISYILSLAIETNFICKFLLMPDNNTKYKCNYPRISIFSSLDEGKNLYITFLTYDIMVFKSDKGGTMVIFNYPYGYILSNIIFINELELFHKLNIFNN